MGRGRRAADFLSPASPPPTPHPLPRSSAGRGRGERGCGRTARGGRGGAVPWRRPGGGGRGRRVQVGSRESLEAREAGRGGYAGLRCDRAAPALFPGACFLATPRCRPSKGKEKTFLGPTSSNALTAHILEKPLDTSPPQRKPIWKKTKTSTTSFYLTLAF